MTSFKTKSVYKVVIKYMKKKYRFLSLFQVVPDSIRYIEKAVRITNRIRYFSRYRPSFNSYINSTEACSARVFGIVLCSAKNN